MAVEKIDRSKCNDCGVCYDVCPMDVFRKLGVVVYMAYPEDCMTCHLCEDYCKQDAIYVNPWQATEVPLPF